MYELEIEKIKKLVSQNYVDDVVLVFHQRKSLDFALKVAEIAEFLQREPSIISRSKNFDDIYTLYSNTTDEYHIEIKSKIFEMLNNGLNKG